MRKLKESTHQRIAPAPQQKRLPAPRRTLRSGAARPSLLALKRQSTLTQLDLGDGQRSSRGSIPDSEGSAEDEDEDFAQPRPKKKQRKSKFGPRARDQSSLTQKWDRPGDAKIEHGSDDEGSRWSNPVVVSEFNGGDARDTQAIAMDLRELIEETPPSSQRIPDSQPSSSVRSIHDEYVLHSSPGHQTTRPTTSISAMNFKTPQKTFKAVIPSSNTPSSVQLSVHGSRARSEYASSPLKERSCNRRTAEVSQGYVTARESPSPLKRTSVPSTARQLQRMNTIHDSQSDDSDVEQDPHPARLLPTATNFILEPRTLKRTITVQDSDGDLDLEDLDGHNDGDDDSTVVEDEQDQQNMAVEDEVDQANMIVEDEPDHQDPTVEGEPEPVNTYSTLTYPQTFDPVSAAMARDAARFGNGPTQMETQYVSFYDQEDENDETLVNEEVEFVAESPVAEVVVEASQELLSANESGNVGTDSAELPSAFDGDAPGQVVPSENKEQSNELPLISDDGLPTVTTSGQDDEPSTELPTTTQPGRETQNEINQQPMSSPPPPQPRPSQMSTVVPTQWTSDRRNSGQESSPISPQKSSAWAGNTLSSSPFPMPPWTFSNPDDDVREIGAVGRSEPQFDSLVDFSLPPPPPMHSSMRQSSDTGVE